MTAPRRPRPAVPLVRTVLAVVVLLAVAACGIPTDSEPRLLADQATSVPEVDTGGASDATLYFWDAEDEQASPVTRGIDPPVTAQAVLNSLLEGASEQDIAQGLTTNIPADTSGAVEVVREGTATVDMSASWGELNRPVVTYAYAQVVGTLCELDSIDGVTFRVDGEPIQAPTVNDGEKPVVTPADYAELGLSGS